MAASGVVTHVNPRRPLQMCFIQSLHAKLATGRKSANQSNAKGRKSVLLHSVPGHTSTGSRTSEILFLFSLFDILNCHLRYISTQVLQFYMQVTGLFELIGNYMLIIHIWIHASRSSIALMSRMSHRVVTAAVVKPGGQVT